MPVRFLGLVGRLLDELIQQLLHRQRALLHRQELAPHSLERTAGPSQKILFRFWKTFLFSFLIGVK
jgi:hypothetical protein